MPDFKNLTLSVENNILTITINRPDSLNALNLETLDEINNALQQALNESGVKGIIFTGTGDKAFIAGADIKELTELNALNSRKFSENGQEIFQAIENSEKPVIAAVNGFALGAGCELAMACHIRIAAEQAKFGQPEVKLGTIPGYGGTQRLTQLVGRGKAMELMMTGKMIDAHEANSLGLVNMVVSSEVLMQESFKMMSAILQQAPIAIANVIRSINSADSFDENGFQTEANGFMNCCGSQDFKEGTSAFIEKRNPDFQGE